MIRVYVCRGNSHLQAHARWLKHSVIGTPDSPQCAAEFWLQGEQDLRDADACVVYGHGEQKLRGALVEAGIAIACGVPVIVVGDHPDYGTWQYHPLVTRVPNVNAAVEHLRTIEPRYRRIRRAP